MELDPGLRETVEPLTDEVTARVGRVVATDGFVYAEASEGVPEKIKAVRSIVTLLGDPSKVAAVTVEGTGIVPWSDSDVKYRTSTFLFVNKETGEAAAFFVREGWI